MVVLPGCGQSGPWRRIGAKQLGVLRSQMADSALQVGKGSCENCDPSSSNSVCSTERTQQPTLSGAGEKKMVTDTL